MWPNQVSNSRPLALESDTLRAVLCGPVDNFIDFNIKCIVWSFIIMLRNTFCH